MRRNRAFTFYEVVVVVIIIALLLGILLPALMASRRTASGVKKASQLRGVHQSMVIFATKNCTYLPGLDSSGNLIPNGPRTGHSGPGDTAAARFWLLLNGQYFDGELLMNPQDNCIQYVSPPSTQATRPAGSPPLPPLTTANFSYAALDIRGMDTSTGRRAEWRDNANSQAVMLSDRNIGQSNADGDVRSFWSDKPGVWKGNQVWGDNHAEFVQSHIIPTTRYGGITQSNDNLFATTRAAGVTEDSTHPEANALMVWN